MHAIKTRLDKKKTIKVSDNIFIILTGPKPPPALAIFFSWSIPILSANSGYLSINRDKCLSS